MATERTIKPRRYDLAPDEFLAAVVGEMTPAELGVYWMICLLQYSRREPIDSDMKWLRRKFKQTHGLCSIEPIVVRLVASGRVVREGNRLEVRRVGEEVEGAQRRIRSAIESGKRGGRPPRKTNGLEKGSGSNNDKPTENGPSSLFLEREREESAKRVTFQQKQGT